MPSRADRYRQISPAVIAEILLMIPARATRAWIGITGGKEPNYAFDIGGRIIRYSADGTVLGPGPFNTQTSVEIDPKTGQLRTLVTS